MLNSPGLRGSYRTEASRGAICRLCACAWFLALGLVADPFSTRAHASCIGGSLEESLQRASIVFAGTLESKEPIRLPRGIHTRHLFRDVRYAKGHGPESGLILTQYGGTLDGHEVGVAGAPVFEVGRRYVIAARWHEEILSAMHCIGGHPFGVWPDRGREVGSVHWNEVSIVHVDSLHVVMIADPPRARSLRRAPGDPDPRSLDEALREHDKTYERPMAAFGDAGSARSLVRLVILPPAEDAGVRVSEVEFLEWLSEVGGFGPVNKIEPLEAR